MYPLDHAYTKERNNLGVAIAAANRLKPAFILVCGDMVSKPGNDNQILAVTSALAPLDTGIRLYFVPGNHDLGNTPTEESLSAYRQKFGADRFAFQHHDVLFVGINSMLIKEPLLLPKETAEQEAWLLRTLTAAHKQHRRVMLVQHHPWFVRKANERDLYFNLPRAARDRWLPLFDSLGVTHVFSGHLHYDLTRSWRGIQFISSGPVGMPLGFDPSGLRIVAVDSSDVSHHYHSLKKIPDR